MMTYENYRKMGEFSIALAESFYNAEIKVEIMEILSENSPMTAKEIAEKFNEKFTSKIVSLEKYWYYTKNKTSIAGHLKKLVAMGKVKIAETKTYPVNISPRGYEPEYITGHTYVYAIA